MHLFDQVSVYSMNLKIRPMETNKSCGCTCESCKKGNCANCSCENCTCTGCTC